MSFYGAVLYFQSFYYLIVAKSPAHKYRYLKLSGSHVVSFLEIRPVFFVEQRNSGPLKKQILFVGIFIKAHRYTLVINLQSNAEPR